MATLDVMLDLETLGTSPGCCVLSIGATTFDGKYQFYEKIDPVDARRYFTENIDTLRWWSKQDSAAREEAFSGTLTANAALLKFANWFESLPAVRKDIQIWGNGADFDLPILKAQYEKFDLVIPWAPYSGRCYRTLKSLLPHVAAPTKNKQKHNALEDAIYQAKHAVTLLQVL